MSTALARRQTSAVGSPATAIRTREDLEWWAHHAQRSGLFKEAEDMSRGIMKMAFGMEYNLTPMQALQSVHLIDGKLSLPGNVLAGLIDNSDRYKYRVEEKTAERCALRFYKRDPDTREWEDLGVEAYTIEQAKGAGLTTKDNWRKYPSKMLFWRALGNGFDAYCAGLQVAKAYHHEEMGATDLAPEDAEYVDAIEVGGDGAPALPPAPPRVSEEQAATLADLATGAYAEAAAEKEGAIVAHYTGGHGTAWADLPAEHYAAVEDGLLKVVAEKAGPAGHVEEYPEVTPAVRTTVEPTATPPAAPTGPLPDHAQIDAWITRQPGDEDEHRRLEKKAHAVGGEAFGKGWNESKKGIRDGQRHRMIEAMTLGQTDSTSRLSVSGLRELIRQTRLADAPEPPLAERFLTGTLQGYALAHLAAMVGVEHDPARLDDEDHVASVVAAFPEAGRDRLAEILADDALCREYNLQAFLANAQTRQDLDAETLLDAFDAEAAAGVLSPDSKSDLQAVLKARVPAAR